MVRKKQPMNKYKLIQQEVEKDSDLFIIVTFGPITVLYAYISQVGSLPEQQQHQQDITTMTAHLYELYLKPLLYALPLVLNTEAILHSNNTRDVEQDRKSGIVTLAMYLGFTGSYILYVGLIFVPYFMFLVAALKYNMCFMLPIVTIGKAFQLEKSFRYKQLADLPKQTAHLNLILGLLYVFACFLSKH